MKYVRMAALWLLLMIALWAGGTVVLWVFDLLMGLNFDNLLWSGFKVGAVAWVMLMVGEIIKRKKKQ